MAFPNKWQVETDASFGNNFSWILIIPQRIYFEHRQTLSRNSYEHPQIA